MKLMAFVLMVAVVSGCSSRGALISGAAGLGIGVTGGVMASNPGGRPQSEMKYAIWGGGLAGLGGLIVVGSLINLIVNAARAPAPSHPGSAR